MCVGKVFIFLLFDFTTGVVVKNDIREWQTKYFET